MRRAIEQDLPFARTLTQQAMSHYYRQNGLLWSSDGFDVAWAGRENWLICNDDVVMGFISLSRDGKALYIRELHLLECCRKQGAGTWVLEQMVFKARVEGLGLSTVDGVQDQPGKKAVSALGLSIVGEEDGFWRMERECRALTSD